jgi:hypothetical protein
MLIIAIATRLLVLYYDGTIIGPDQGFQMAATKSLMEGRGITLEVFQLDDISATSTYNLTWWPPLYSYLSAPLLALTGDFVTVLVMTVWFSVIVLYIAWFFILEQLAPLLGAVTRAAIWLYWIFISPMGSQAEFPGATDYLSMALFSVAVACALRFIRNPDASLGWSIAGGVAMGIGGSLRYSIIPLIAVVPLAHLALMILQRRVFGLRHLALFVAIPAVLVAVLILPSYLDDAADPTALVGSVRPFSAMIDKASPFPVISFGVRTRWFVYSPETALLWVLSAGVILACAAVLIRWLMLYRRPPFRRQADASALVFFLICGALTTAIIPAFLGFLTYRQPLEYTRTLVENTRYYIPAAPFLLAVAAFGLLQRQIRPRLLYYASLVLFTVIVTLALIGERPFFEGRFSRQPFGVRLNADNPYWHYYHTILDLRSQGREVAFLSNYQPNAIKAWASLAGASIYDSIDSAPIEQAIDTGQPVTVVVMLWERDDMSESDLAQRDYLVAFMERGTATLNHTLTDWRGSFEEYIVEIP